MRKKRTSIVLQDILVEDYAAEGKSLARIDGKVIFIENTIPGDVVDIQIWRSKKDWAEAFPKKYKKFSPDRLTPFCSHFGVCGGCQWQMLPYQKQLIYKQQQVTDNLERIAKVPLPYINTIIGADSTVHYRNKLEFTFTNKRFIPQEEFSGLKANGIEPNREGFFAGFHAKGVFDKVVEIDTCHLQEEPTNLIRKEIIAFAQQNKITLYDIAKHTGWLRSMMVRIVTTGEIMLNICVGYQDDATTELLLNHVNQVFPQITTLFYTINTKWNDSMFDQTPILFSGRDHIVEKLGNYQFKIGPKSFFQTNTKQAEKLYSITKEYAELNGSQIVYDLYCGTGSIGIFVSDQAKAIVGVEVVEEAIHDAKENASVNNITNASFYAGDVVNICNDQFFQQNGTPDVVITDPPRAGMHEKLIKKLLEIAAPIVVYVSCNPATQARDLALLDEKYMVTKVQPVDMFPHTHHIENVVQLKLK